MLEAIVLLSLAVDLALAVDLVRLMVNALEALLHSEHCLALLKDSAIGNLASLDSSASLEDKSEPASVGESADASLGESAVASVGEFVG